MTEAWMTTNEHGQVANSLDELEDTIAQGLQTFVEVGQALAEIRDRRLYRNDFGTFEAYCADRWNLTRKRAYDLMGAAEIVATMSPIGDTPPPVNESQARELAPLREQPEVVRDIWQDVHRQTNGKPTAAVIRDTVKRHLAAVPPAPVQDEKFWNEAAEKLTDNGWVAKRDAERPYIQTLVRLKRIASDFADLDMNPVSFAENFPADSADALPAINALYSWLHTFFTIKES